MSGRPLVLDESNLTTEQQAVFDRIRAGPRGLVEGPLRVWLASPQLADHAQALGAFCRYGTRLPQRLSELAILIVGAHWQAGFEWHVHAPLAVKAGVEPAVAEAIRRGADPKLERKDEAAVHRFSVELLRRKHVTDEAYAAAEGELGREALVELVGILGYYTLISMTINAFKVPIPGVADDPFGDLRQRSS
jgi:4-carboxymuconolactone decarboxylase